MDRALGGWVALAAVMSLSGCFSDERWEGRLSHCDNNGYNDLQVLLTVDVPRAPNPTGWAGRAGAGSRDTWVISEIEHTSGVGPTFKYDAYFDMGAWTERWTMDLTAQGFTTYDGDAEITAGGTVRCDVTLKRQ